MQITDMTLCGLSAAMDGGKVSSVEATRACLERIRETAELNNFITTCEAEALELARNADARRRAGENDPLLGVPVAVKDNIATRGIKTTCASELLRDFVPSYDAAVVEKLKAAGAVIIGKTNMDEFAMGSTNENSAFGAVKNALDTRRVPGGSSGGSANCVAARVAFGALGSDTGGSVRQPSAYCGVVGLKPTYSAVSRYGLIAFASSLDQIGTLTRDCDDALRLFGVLIGKDGRDPTSGAYPKLPLTLHSDIRGKTIGVADEFINTDKLDGEVRGQFEQALSVLSNLGAKIKRVSIKSFNTALFVYYALSGAEAAVNLSRFDGARHSISAHEDDVLDVFASTRGEMLGAEVKRRIMTGSFVLDGDNYDAYYVKAAKIRTVLKREYESALTACDAIVCPTSPTTAPKLGEWADPAINHFSDMYTVPANLCGLPAVSVPFGRAHGMPIGVQIIGKSFAEGEILGIGKAIMQAAN